MKVSVLMVVILKQFDLLNIKVGLLPRTHGSALFTRGETQALVVATMGTERDAQALMRR